MGKIEDIIIQARKNLVSSDLLTRPDFEELYADFNNEELRQLFSSLHYHYVKLFSLMNERLPTDENSNHFWADSSRNLIKIIDITNLLESGLKNTEWAFTVAEEYKEFINRCRKFLRKSCGSPIPPYTPEAPIYHTRKIFIPDASIKVDCSFSSQGHFKKYMIGNGSYANVYKYRDEFYGKDFVVKTARRDLSEKDKERFRKEFEIMHTLSSPYIAEVYKYIEDRDEFIMEKLDGTLADYVSLNNNKPEFDIDARRRVCFQIFKAFEYIHSKNILHRDISPTNILFKQYDDAVVIKIADLGLVKTTESYLTSTETEMKGCCNDPKLRIDGYANYTIAHEIYALTIIIKYVLTGSLHINKIKDEKLKSFVLRGTSPDYSQRFSSVVEMRRAFKYLGLNDE
ncbi:MAG: protein kinase family protein [Akkermansia sp.]|nr:protein kinase family protein [Akkermansia sp.]